MENKFSETLRFLLQQRGVTHAKLAEVLGVATNSVTVYCTGKARPNIDTLIKIASYFGVSLDYLITGQNPENKILTSELGLSEGTLQTLKELAGKVYGEKLFGLSGELDRLIRDPDFLETFFDAICKYQHKANLYPLVKEKLEEKGEEAIPELYMDIVEGEAAGKLYSYFRKLFKKDNIMRDRYRDNNSPALKSMLNKLTQSIQETTPQEAKPQ